MELRHLEHFLAVADAGSFTKAARNLHLVQSGVSATIKTLEHELGAALFVRTPGAVVLTAAGRALLPRARETLVAAGSAKDAVHRTQGTLQGEVTVGTLTSVNVVDLPDMLSVLRDRHPAVTVRLRAAAGGSADLAQQLRDGLLDVAFMSLPDPQRLGLDTRLLAVAPLSLYVPSAHPLVGAGRVVLAQLGEFPFVDSPQGFGNRTVVDQAFAAAGVDREVTLEVADIGTAVNYIRAGLGIGFLSRFLVEDHTGLDVLEIADHDLRWRFSVATASRRRPSGPTEAFLDLLRERYPSTRDLGR
ncbi:DNA-binding transcriptional regulator, LysR family [Actinacidiphila yanglinensis]|uniref:DNA-binding transcriptional regulator, LysR family n=1 Tax=Actinacidiphila yanglinensis TaxID=310779 RepID=A0A1H6BCE8_9ACTN|nr:LysR family transcriptional regulator [Actinacidiphila yanglinensis]SEG57876.1 DNA-binding transcriptional regulator, LysR family [Actinacidiphila yanglinensis]